MNFGPRDFLWEGAKASIEQQLGNTVPPPPQLLRRRSTATSEFMDEFWPRESSSEKPHSTVAEGVDSDRRKPESEKPVRPKTVAFRDQSPTGQQDTEQPSAELRPSRRPSRRISGSASRNASRSASRRASRRRSTRETMTSEA